MTHDQQTAEQAYAIEGVDLEEAKRLKAEAKHDGWNAHVDRIEGDRYAVRVFGPRFWQEPDPAA